MSLKLTKTDRQQFRSRTGPKQQFDLMDTYRQILEERLDNSKYRGLFCSEFEDNQWYIKSVVHNDLSIKEHKI